MAHQEDERGYALPLRIIHWLMALMMIAMICAGIWMVNGDWGGKYPPLRGQLFDFHRGVGFILMMLVVIRLIIYRFTKPPSPLPASIAPIQKKAADAVHFLLYTALFIQPFLGWYGTNVWGAKKITIFGWFNLPPLAEKNRELGDQLLAIHGYLGLFIATLVCIHVGAALMHHFVFKDNVLMRMTKG